jgi:hypothetical protein
MVEIERERIERRKRIEDAATVGYLALEKRSSTRAVVAESEHGIASGVGAILADGADLDRTAALCDPTPAQVRSLMRSRVNVHRADETAYR